METHVSQPDELLTDPEAFWQPLRQRRDRGAWRPASRAGQVRHLVHLGRGVSEEICNRLVRESRNAYRFFLKRVIFSPTWRQYKVEETLKPVRPRNLRLSSRQPLR